MQKISFVIEVLTNYFGPSFPLPESEKKLDFSPSFVEIYRPIRKIVGTPTKSKLAIKPKLVVSMNSVTEERSVVIK